MTPNNVSALAEEVKRLDDLIQEYSVARFDVGYAHGECASTSVVTRKAAAIECEMRETFQRMNSAIDRLASLASQSEEQGKNTRSRSEKLRDAGFTHRQSVRAAIQREADTERLDFLVDCGAWVDVDVTVEVLRYCVMKHDRNANVNRVTDWHASPRQAIDAAMAAPKEGA